MERLLPRHMQIIYLINAAHLDGARRRGFIDPSLLASISLIDEHAGRRVRMGNLAFVGSHKINGVSALHTDLMRKTVFHSLNTVYPGRIVNKTNGITFRRWLIECNPGLTGIIRATVGERGARRRRGAQELRRLRRRSGDAGSRRRGQARHQGGARRATSPRSSASASIRTRCSTCRSSASTNTSASSSTSSRRSRSTTRSAPIRRIDFAPRVKIFAGKAAASYDAGQADHQARHRRRPGRQHRPDACAACSRWCSCRTTMSPSPRRSSRPPISPSRFRPPAWRPRAPAT